MVNRLGSEKSPYLLQHRDNPVEWYAWGEEAFREAVLQDKPVFLSIGYSTCHWCHVMARESFEDEEVAGILNQNYICIKVDREERPDIDMVYMSVCQAVTGAGGWPLTIIMTPEQKPFFAGTYFPKKGRYGSMGLMELLVQIAKMWKNDRKPLLNAGEEITAVIRQKDNSPEDIRKNSFQNADGKTRPEKEILNKAYRLFQNQFDTRWGGFGSAPKFPSPHNLLFLMRYAHEEHSAEGLRMVEVTLDAMARGGIYDHIGGGFSRYSTDEKWLVPHFEKMLYDNALLILAYTEAYQLTKKEEYAQIVRSTADYILRELTDEEGGFYCGQDADSEGEEGKYYVFFPEEVEFVLGVNDGRKFLELYGITEAGNFEGKNIVNRIGQKEEGWPVEDARMKKLYEYRLKRTKLHKDDKILLSWSAWTIIALARAGRVLGEERYLNAGRKAQKFIEKNMTDTDHRLYIRFRDGEAAHAGQLEDYAVYALALLELYLADFQAEHLEGALLRVEQMRMYFKDQKHGGYYATASDAEQLIVRPKETYDGAIPSGNSVAAMVLNRLAMLTGEVKWQEEADEQMQFLEREIREYPTGYAFSLLAMEDVIGSHRELICAVSGEVPKELEEYRRRDPGYGLNVLVKTEENAGELSDCAPFTREYPVPKQGAVYYLCENGACRAPVTDLSALDL